MQIGTNGKARKKDTAEEKRKRRLKRNRESMKIRRKKAKQHVSQLETRLRELDKEIQVLKSAGDQDKQEVSLVAALRTRVVLIRLRGCAQRRIYTIR